MRDVQYSDTKTKHPDFGLEAAICPGRHAEVMADKKPKMTERECIGAD